MNAVPSKRIALFFWEGYLGVAPSLINGIRLLAANGYVIDIILRHNRRAFAEIPEFGPAVRLHICKPLFSALDDRSAGKPGAVTHILHMFALAVNLVQFTLFGLRGTKNATYAAMIGVDMYGIVAAKLSSSIRRCPLLYWSLEIHFLAEFRNPVRRLVKRLERRFSRDAAMTIIQDRDRAETLTRENGLSPAHVVIVPNSPLGPSVRVRSRYFHEQFGLPENARIVLHTGWIDDSTLSMEVARAAAEWPAGYVLVLHERQKRSPAEPYLQSIATASKDRAVLSLNPVPYDQLDHVVGGAHIGLVVYSRELGPNFAQIASASGKLGHYFRCGLPVVAIDLPGLREVMEDNHCGLVVRSVEEIAAALDRIFADYAAFSANARKCYEAHFEFGRYFQEVLTRLDSVQRAGQSGSRIVAAL